MRTAPAPAAGKLVRLRDARGDPELADRQVDVRLEQDVRLRQHRVALASCVLDEVLLQLADERALEGSELRAVAG